jgi:hypothetical protein
LPHIYSIPGTHLNVTTNPTAKWTARQGVEAFAWTSAPRYLLRDHGGIYGYAFQRRLELLHIEHRRLDNERILTPCDGDGG